jgi:hypothetical protein
MCNIKVHITCSVAEDLDQAQAKYAKTKAELEQTLADLNDM